MQSASQWQVFKRSFLWVVDFLLINGIICYSLKVSQPRHKSGTQTILLPHKNNCPNTLTMHHCDTYVDWKWLMGPRNPRCPKVWRPEKRIVVNDTILLPSLMRHCTSYDYSLKWMCQRMALLKGVSFQLLRFAKKREREKKITFFCVRAWIGKKERESSTHTLEIKL